MFSGNWTAESIATFIQGEELPLVVTFSDEVSQTKSKECVLCVCE